MDESVTLRSFSIWHIAPNLELYHERLESVFFFSCILWIFFESNYYFGLLLKGLINRIRANLYDFSCHFHSRGIIAQSLHSK